MGLWDLIVGKKQAANSPDASYFPYDNARPSFTILGDPASAKRLDSVIRKNLNPKVYDYLVKRNLTIHVHRMPDGLEQYMGMYTPHDRGLRFNLDYMSDQHGEMHPEFEGTVVHEFEHAFDAVTGSEIYEKLTGKKLEKPMRSHHNWDELQKDAAAEGSITPLDYGTGVGSEKYARVASLHHKGFHEQFLKDKAEFGVYQKEAQKIRTQAAYKSIEAGEKARKFKFGSPEWTALYDKADEFVFEGEEKVRGLARARADLGVGFVTEYAATDHMESFAEQGRIAKGLFNNAVGDDTEMDISTKMANPSKVYTEMHEDLLTFAESGKVPKRFAEQWQEKSLIRDEKMKLREDFLSQQQIAQKSLSAEQQGGGPSSSYRIATENIKSSPIPGHVRVEAKARARSMWGGGTLKGGLVLSVGTSLAAIVTNRMIQSDDRNQRGRPYHSTSSYQKNGIFG